MQLKLSDNQPPKAKGGEIYITNEQRERLVTLDKSDYNHICQSFRLDLQSRILGLSGDDLIKLQGKLEYVDELERFFLGLLK